MGHTKRKEGRINGRKVDTQHPILIKISRFDSAKLATLIYCPEVLAIKLALLFKLESVRNIVHSNMKNTGRHSKFLEVDGDSIQSKRKKKGVNK